MENNKSDLSLLHVGFDTLEVSFQGALCEEAIAQLEDAKITAQREYRDQLILLGPERLPVHVGQTGTRGGYAFRFDTGVDGETWFVKRSTDPQQWNLRTSVKSLPLASYGYKHVVARLWCRLKAMGARVLDESISRVDIAADFFSPQFQLVPEQFVAHWRCRRRAFANGTKQPVAFSENPDEISVNFSGRRVTSVTIGSMPNRQLIVYDKRREAIDTRKLHWFAIWSQALSGVTAEQLRADSSFRVWRIEVRAGKDYLADFGLKRFVDLDTMVGDVLRMALKQVRYLSPEDNRNVSRRQSHPFWEAARAAYLEVLAAPEMKIEPSKVRAGKRAELQTVYKSLITGFVASYSVALGLDTKSERLLAKRITSDIIEYIRENRDRFESSHGRASERLFFYDDANFNAPVIGQ